MKHLYNVIIKSFILRSVEYIHNLVDDLFYLKMLCLYLLTRIVYILLFNDI